MLVSFKDKLTSFAADDTVRSLFWLTSVLVFDGAVPAGLTLGAAAAIADEMAIAVVVAVTIAVLKRCIVILPLIKGC